MGKTTTKQTKFKVQFQWSDYYGQDTWEDKVICLNKRQRDNIINFLETHYNAYVYFTDDIVLCDLMRNDYYGIERAVDEAFEKLKKLGSNIQIAQHAEVVQYLEDEIVNADLEEQIDNEFISADDIALGIANLIDQYIQSIENLPSEIANHIAELDEDTICNCITKYHEMTSSLSPEILEYVNNHLPERCYFLKKEV